MLDSTTYSLSGPDPAVRECPECGLFQAIPALRPGTVADCRRCGALLRRRRRDSFNAMLAFNVTGLVLYGIAVTAPLLGLRLAGQQREATMPSVPVAFDEFGAWQLTWMVAATTLAAPLLKLCLTAGVIVGLRIGAAPALLAAMARWRKLLTPWAMIEVFLLGAFVAYTRLVALAEVEVGAALYALGALMLVMVASDAWLDEHALWEAIGRRRQLPAAAEDSPVIGCDQCGRVSRVAPGTPCPRCDAVLRIRKPDSMARCAALLVAATALYVPANMYPVMTVVRLGSGQPSTILGGVEELIEYEMWPLALLVFVASVLVPVFKLASLAYLLVSIRRRSAWRLRDRTRLYRIVDVIGRWSMIDVFMLAVLVALVRMGALASVTPGLGGVCFAGVVVLTMLAAFSFDPRLMWDAAGQTGCDAAETEA